MSSGLQFTTSLTIGHCIRGVSPNITYGMEISRVRIARATLSILHITKCTGTGEGPRATSCAFWNEFMPMLRKENRTGEFSLLPPTFATNINFYFILVTIKCDSQKTESKPISLFSKADSGNQLRYLPLLLSTFLCFTFFL